MFVRSRHPRFVAMLFAAALVACALPAFGKEKIEAPEIADDARNPPPSAALATYQRFELAPVAMGAPWTEYKANAEALDNLQRNLDERAKPLIAEWNAKEAGEAPRTLKIQPEIAYVRFITGGKRFFGGAFAGKSAVLLKVRLIDADTGETIAEPQFYQHANAFSAAYSFGAADKHMMIRISAMVTDYLKNNYDAAVGGMVAVAPGHEETDDTK